MADLVGLNEGDDFLLEFGQLALDLSHGEGAALVKEGGHDGDGFLAGGGFVEGDDVGEFLGGEGVDVELGELGLDGVPLEIVGVELVGEGMNLVHEFLGRALGLHAVEGGLESGFEGVLHDGLGVLDFEKLFSEGETVLRVADGSEEEGEGQDFEEAHGIVELKGDEGESGQSVEDRGQDLLRWT